MEYYTIPIRRIPCQGKTHMLMRVQMFQEIEIEHGLEYKKLHEIKQN